MAAVTQLVQNFLGGVSTQVDNKKLVGQVREADNAYPDPTFGMLKRNGMRFVRTCLLYTSPSPRDGLLSRMPSSA